MSDFDDAGVTGAQGEIPMGTVVDGRFELESVVSASSSATLYVAIDQRTDGLVMLRLFTSEASASRGEAILEQAASSFEMIHPNVVRVVAYGRADVRGSSRVYVVSERLTGGTLQDMIDGSAWHYSVSVDVQGYLVEKLSGMGFDEFLQQRLFDPLGMVDTRFHVGRDRAHRFSREYTSGPDGLSSPENGEFIEPRPFLSGGGGLTGTAHDYLRFAQMLANGGELDGVRILKPETVELMRTSQLPEGITEIPGYPGNAFGLDVAIVTDPASNGGMSAGSYWWWGIAGTWFWIDPVQDLVFVGMIQNRNLRYARELQLKSKQLVYDALE